LYLDARQAELQAMCSPKKPVPAPVKHVLSEKVPLSPIAYLDARHAELRADDQARRAAAADREMSRA